MQNANFGMMKCKMPKFSGLCLVPSKMPKFSGLGQNPECKMTTILPKILDGF
jgi:hypothetical protein